MRANATPLKSSDSISWAVIAALVAVVAAVELARPMLIEPRSLVGLALACAALCSAATFYTRVRIDARFSACCLSLAQALLFSAVGSILSYLLARNSGALWDSALGRWDQALGLDWLAYAHFVDRHAWLATIYALAYASLIPQTIVVILALGFGGKLDQLRAFVLAAILSGSAAVLLSPLFPAVGNFAHLGLKPHDFAHVWQSTDLADVRDFVAVRNATIGVLDLRTLQGIIVFPSYHAALATVTFWSFWKSGLNSLRWLGVAVAVLTIAATPVNGGHYFVDVIAGIALAIGSIAAANRLIFVSLPMRRIKALPFRRSREAFAR